MPKIRFVLKLYLVTTLDGMPVIWWLADPKLGEREVATELLGHAHDLATFPAGVVLIGDKGFAGKDFARDLAELAITFVRPDRRDEPRRHSNPGHDPPTHRSNHPHRQGPTLARTPRRAHPAGVMARVTQRVLALAAAIWHNWATNAPVKRSLIAYDH